MERRHLNPAEAWSYYCYRQNSKRSAKSRFEGEKPTRAYVEGDDGNNGMKIARVGIIMGSDSDLPVMKETKDILDFFGVPNEVTIISAHRTTKRMVDYVETSKERGIKLIIAGARRRRSPSRHGSVTNFFAGNWDTY